MTSALDTIRYHSGIAGEEVADMVDSLEREVFTLREQVKKLTKERDDLRSRRCEVCGYLEHEREHTGCLREQLAALAEQNEKMRKVLVEAKSMVGHPDNIAVINTALSIPNLATPVLNRIKAEAYREAAMHCSKHGSRTADEVSEDLFANADELEQSK